MSKTIAQQFFNSYLTDFVTDYVKLYGNIATGVRDIVVPELKDICNNCSARTSNDFSTESFRQWTDAIQPMFLSEMLLLPEMVQIVGSYFILPVDTYQNMLLTSFRDPSLVKLLKASNISRLLEEDHYNKCVILQQLQLKKVVQHLKGGMDQEALSTIAKGLNGAYYIAQFVAALPVEFSSEFDTAHQTDLSVNSFGSILNVLKNSFTNWHLLQLWDCLIELFWSPYTPLYSLIPEHLHATVSNAITVLGNQSMRLAMLNRLPELFQHLEQSQIYTTGGLCVFVGSWSEFTNRNQKLLVGISSQPQTLRQYLQSAPDSLLNLQDIDNAALAV